MAPSSLLFTLTLITGTFISLSSTNWLYLWMGMELNLLSFIPLMATSQSLQETEASIKYFIIQAIGSGLMLTAGIMSMNPFLMKNFYFLISISFFISMAMKLGMAPCHQWLPHVMSGIPWIHCMILATWQKISPMIMLILIMNRDMYALVAFTAMLNALVGGLGGLNQTQLRTLLAYSSIGHMGWMISTLESPFYLFSTYFLVYIIISISLMTMMYNNNLMLSKLSYLIISLNYTSFLMTTLMLFSLGGLPPFLGFIPKWLIISHLAHNHSMILMSTLILGSLMNLFYYFNMSFNFILSWSNPFSTNYTPFWSIILMLLCTLGSSVLIL
nr:NADH dehydrogenase subunit 2 [Perinereis sp. PA-2020]